ncbi:MAG: beta-ketoacyl synthase chain length factor [Proteobacteria bacterium]|nr:beta-ketoacyl synthase chain length factor [Pseudomonadota bacterium]
MSQLSFGIKGWAAWTPADGEFGMPDGTVPSGLRRRVGPLGQSALRAAWGLKGADRSRLVFASRHGEFGRTAAIMDTLARHGEVSPADFSLSVHHALAGLLSIVTANGRGHTAIAAGHDSFFNALLEATAGLADGSAEDVTLVYYDEPLPAPFSGFNGKDEEHIVLALLMSAAEGVPMRLTTRMRDTDTPVTPRPAETFLRCLLQDRARGSAAGQRTVWRWEKADAAH